MTLLVGSIFHMTRKIVSEMTYNVSMGTLNPTIPYLYLRVVRKISFKFTLNNEGQVYHHSSRLIISITFTCNIMIDMHSTNSLLKWNGLAIIVNRKQNSVSIISVWTVAVHCHCWEKGKSTSLSKSLVINIAIQISLKTVYRVIM